MPVITISRQFGSGGSSVAKLVAERRHLDVVDQALIAEVARRASVPLADVEAEDEHSASLLDRLAAPVLPAGCRARRRVGPPVSRRGLRSAPRGPAADPGRRARGGPGGQRRDRRPGRRPHPARSPGRAQRVPARGPGLPRADRDAAREARPGRGGAAHPPDGRQPACLQQAGLRVRLARRAPLRPRHRHRADRDSRARRASSWRRSSSVPAPRPDVCTTAAARYQPVGAARQPRSATLNTFQMAGLMAYASA